MAVRFVGTLGSRKELDHLLADFRTLSTEWKRFEIDELTAEAVEATRKKHENVNKIRGLEFYRVERVVNQTKQAYEISASDKAEVRGMLVKVHHDVEAIPIAFMDYEDFWLCVGSVWVPLERIDALERVLGMLHELQAKGVKLEARQVWVDEDKRVYDWDIEAEIYHSDAAARGENPYYPGLPAVPETGYRFPNPTGAWKTEAREWFRRHHGEIPRIIWTDINNLYRAGAVRVDFEYSHGVITGCEVIPPTDISSRKRLYEAMQSVSPKIGRDEGEVGGQMDYTYLRSVVEDPSNVLPWQLF